MKPFFQLTARDGKVYLSHKVTADWAAPENYIGEVTKDSADGIRKLRKTCELMQKFMASLPPTELTGEKQNRQAMQKTIKRALS